MTTKRRFLWKRWLVFLGALCLIALAYPLGVLIQGRFGEPSSAWAFPTGLVALVGLAAVGALIFFLLMGILSLYDWLMGKEKGDDE